MRRLIVTITVTSLLSVSFLLYCAIITPLTRAEMAPALNPLASETEFRPPSLISITEEFFPDDPWTKEASFSWQRSTDSYLFSENVNIVESTDPGIPSNSVEMKPLAILWKDPRRPHVAPFRLLAEKAYVQFERPFFGDSDKFGDSDPGRIVWASLEGPVHIDGPDGLQLDGRQFVFSERAAQLWSDAEISFAYGPSEKDGTQVLGHANKINLSLVPSNDAVLGKDLPRIAGVAQVMLRQNVHLEITSPKQGKVERAIINSAGPFEFDLISGLATFDRDVKVDHYVKEKGRTKFQKLTCEWLGIQFTEPPDHDVKTNANGWSSGKSLFSGRKFWKMSAQSRPTPGRPNPPRVVLESEEHGIIATMQYFMYNAIEKIAVLTDDKQVRVERGETTFLSPRIRIAHGEGKSLDSLHCSGSGQVQVVDPETEQVAIESSWEGTLEAVPLENSPYHLMTLNQNARILVPQQVHLVADRMKMTIDLATQLEDAEKSRLKADEANTNSPLVELRNSEFLKRELPLKRAVAEGRVRLQSSQLLVKQANVIDLTVVPGPVDEIENPQVDNPKKMGEEEATVGKEPEPPWQVEADRLRVDLIHDRALGKIGLRKLVGDGPMKFEQDLVRPASFGEARLDGPIEITGIGLIAENGGGVSQSVTLLGEIDEHGVVQKPALLTLGELEFGGANVSLFRDANRVEVNGPGVVQFPVTESPDGKKLEKPALLRIVWQERMTFDGLVARCFGTVKTTLQDSETNITRLFCEDLSATLNQRVSLRDARARPRNLSVETIHARHQVDALAYEFQGSAVVGVRSAKLHSFELNQTTGEFRGSGPGILKTWSFGDSVKLSPSTAVGANQPATPGKPKWRYTKVEFAGQLTGNMHRGTGVLEERVDVVSAPVSDKMHEFHPRQFSEQTDQAANAVTLKCDRLEAILRSVPDSRKKFAEVLAKGSTELVGQKFRGVAEELKYDEQRGQFVFRGLGRDADLYFQRKLNGPVEHSSHRMIEFIPSEPRLIFDGSTGFKGGF
ncbi:MAG: hypothetical protein KDA80_00170 [Planctomycetaceae bacterium]|nr:hypothetical protein [Planctomycetaceae bacterium]